ncbi:LuxR C-terminal-related transcriptional regulator [Gordonia hongkongensis]|uniref:LuxR C-terminal-related transcriptional regulator n=1 Tax=Gordonia hongkongensis TaxID=1701090 RepID=A0AAX3TAF0_9ACTN|nr:LuxR C-terminal-related transcriptional regulator [Gordonia hongkongensis]QIK49150.1 DNA-binding response regulator [Gordonia terrae]WFP25939.1 LuxR C-terminal-related transcriptional regulator [Gordonia hongkongensis]
MTIQALDSVGRPALSKREVEVLTVWLACDSKQQAARRLFVGESTVHTHLTRIRDKYRVVGRPAPSKIALLIRAIEDGICTLEEIASLTALFDKATEAQRRQQHPSNGRNLA